MWIQQVLLTVRSKIYHEPRSRRHSEKSSRALTRVFVRYDVAKAAISAATYLRCLPPAENARPGLMVLSTSTGSHRTGEIKTPQATLSQCQGVVGWTSVAMEPRSANMKARDVDRTVDAGVRRLTHYSAESNEESPFTLIMPVTADTYRVGLLRVQTTPRHYNSGGPHHRIMFARTTI